MSREDYQDPLYRESIPVRITPPPDTCSGPTEQWRIAEAHRALWSMASEAEAVA